MKENTIKYGLYCLFYFLVKKILNPGAKKRFGRRFRDFSGNLKIQVFTSKDRFLLNLTKVKNYFCLFSTKNYKQGILKKSYFL